MANSSSSISSTPPPDPANCVDQFASLNPFAVGSGERAGTEQDSASISSCEAVASREMTVVDSAKTRTIGGSHSTDGSTPFPRPWPRDHPGLNIRSKAGVGIAQQSNASISSAQPGLHDRKGDAVVARRLGLIDNNPRLVASVSASRSDHVSRVSQAEL